MLRRLDLLTLAIAALLLGILAASVHLAVTGSMAEPTHLPTRGRYAFDIALTFAAALTLIVTAFIAARRQRHRMARVLIATATILLSVGALDLYVLGFRFDSSGPGGVLSVTHTNWYERYVHNNADGFWEDDVAPYERDRRGRTLVVAAIGDSFTWGQGLQGREFRFTDLLQRDLPEHNGRPLRFLNFGKGGTGTVLQNRQIVPVLARVRPDVVVLSYLFNDLEDELGLVKVNGLPIAPRERYFLAATPFANYLFWSHFVTSRLPALGTEMTLAWATNYMDDRSFASHQQQLQEMFDAVRKMGAKPAAVLMPYPQMWINVTPPFRDRIYARITAAFDALQVPVLSLRDLEDQFPPGAFEVNPNDSHPGPAVHRAIADRIRPWLLAQHLLD